ncbi:MAG: isocitrate/isopropylmalate dehydrogenase family protein [Chloroflexi bacterium]|nr:isocitrate/isopropylmalate dehydrogenase family protein [Chloroflexota bacterium]
MTHTICLMEGDGIGREVVPAAAEALAALGLDLRFTRADIGYGAYLATGQALPDATVAAILAADATLFGAVTTPVGIPNYRSPVVALRRSLDLHANIRPVQSLPVAGSRAGVNLWIVRENTEDLYVGEESSDGERATALRVITRAASERIARTAYDLARQQGLGRVTIVHKANVLRETDGLFRAACLTVAADYPGIVTDEQLVDSMAMKLILQPERYAVIVTTNMFGDILSDEAAALVGGLGTLPAANIGARAAVFEPVHGSAPDIAGQGIANPVATLLAAALLLDHIGEPAAARRLRSGVTVALADGVGTPDLGGRATTREMTAAVIDRLDGQP